MVQVFKQRVSEGFEWVFPVDDADYEVFRGFDGTSRLGSWRPISMQLGWEVDDDNPPYRPAAMPWMGTDVLFLKREAVEVLGDALSQWGELLPLQNDETDLYVFNALYSLPALDEEHSDIVRFESGRIMMVDRYVFDPAVIGDVEIFRLSQMLRGSIFFTAPIVELINSAGFEGTTFELVWTDETTE